MPGASVSGVLTAMEALQPFDERWVARNLRRRKDRFRRRNEAFVRQGDWRLFLRGAGVYARGTVRHSDHKTVRLEGWHRVYMNLEHDAPFAQNVAFLD